tara:strand:+ start:49 stop:1743 length:1695 start_codon:yes stop_codon:yes gene_type:complete
MYSKIKQFLDAAPRALTSANEIYNFARNRFKQIMGVFPDGLDDVFLKRGAAEMQDARKKVIEFPQGGKDKTDPFTPRPDPRVIQPKGAKMDVIRANENIAGGSGYAKGDTKYNADVLADEIALMRGADRDNLSVDDQIKLYGEAYDYLAQLNRLNNPSAKGEFGITVLDDAGKSLETKSTTPEGIMDFLMGKGKSKDVNIGKAPKTTKKKPAVDPELQKSEDQKQMFLDFEDRIETEEPFNKLIDPKSDTGIKLGKVREGLKKRETEAEMLERMNRQNKEAVERIKKRKEKDFDPEDKADGGRIGFSGGGAGFAGNQMEHGDSTGSFGPGPTFKEPKIDTMPQPQLNPMMFNMPMLQRPMPQGIIGLKNGGPPNPGRRTFMKTMAGLAALPVVGKFFKPVAKVAKTAGPAIAEGVKLGFDKFMMLVDKIKRLGRPADNLATQERQKVTRYEGKDGNEYELVEDLTTGDIRVTKDKPGFATYGDESYETIEDRSTFEIRRGQADETTKGKTPPDEYDEGRAIADQDGTFSDFDEVDDKTVKEILEELGETRTKKAGGGLAYMLGE